MRVWREHAALRRHLAHERSRLGRRARAFMLTMWLSTAVRISSPGLQCTRIAIRLHIVPLGRKMARSLPGQLGDALAQRGDGGVLPRLSSPTGADAMASRMAGVGRVPVSLIRSMRILVLMSVCRSVMLTLLLLRC